MNFRVFVRTLFFVVLIATVAFTVYVNVAVPGGEARAGADPAKIAVENTGGGQGTSVSAEPAETRGDSNTGENGEIIRASEESETTVDSEASEASETSGVAGDDGSQNASGHESTLSRSYVKNAVTIKISALGDVALGQDHSFLHGDSFDYVFEKQKGDYSYFFSNVVGILSKDDLTIANLETTLSTETQKAEKYDYGNNYWFNGKPEYANILKAGSVEVANLANNHTYDYGQKGYDATRKALETAGIDYFGYTDILVRDVKGIRVGMIGFNQLGNVEQGLDMTVFKKEVAEETKKLRKECDLLIANFHWGKEYQYEYNAIQKELACLVIDSGADLVIGNHPHVLQRVEQYKGKYIAYSLGNFCFGGTKTPKDYDTAIYQQAFVFDSDKVLQPVAAPTVVPCSVSSLKTLNNYKPTAAVEPQISSVLKKLGLTSASLAGGAAGAESDKKTMVKVEDVVKNIVIDLKYASSDNITGKPVYKSNTAYLRKGTADKLNKANQILLKQGYRIKVWDAYRAQKYQQILYDSAKVKSYFMDPKKGSVHTRGSAIDCTLVDAEGNELNMPSGFDEMSTKASRGYTRCTAEQKKNALLLENAMKSCGFIPLSTEWWHFDDTEYKNYPLLAVYPPEK